MSGKCVFYKMSGIFAKRRRETLLMEAPRGLSDLEIQIKKCFLKLEAGDSDKKMRNESILVLNKSCDVYERFIFCLQYVTS